MDVCLFASNLQVQKQRCQYPGSQLSLMSQMQLACNGHIPYRSNQRFEASKLLFSSDHLPMLFLLTQQTIVTLHGCDFQQSSIIVTRRTSKET
eukprot:m.140848 g.140848  ORF g.140848 m.140848 type:complete len:93 (+) comp15969_c0_seq1:194-472(+)